jgi:hypothetical protein
MRTAIAIGLFIGMIGCGSADQATGVDAGTDAQATADANADVTRAGPDNCTWVFTYNSATGMTTSTNVCSDGGQAIADANACATESTDIIGFGDCKATLSDGTECVTNCGRLPEDGGVVILPPGCQINISGTTREIGTCVASCADCSAH